MNGYVSEGSGENIFVVMNGTIITPPLANSALPGITRDSIITLCRDLGIPVAEQMIPREMLYIADEVFLQRHRRRSHPDSLGRPRQGRRRRAWPVTKRVQEEFFAITSGKKPDRHGWLSPVGVPAVKV